MNAATSLSPIVMAGLALTPVAIAVGQVLFKMASGRLNETGGALHMVLFDPVMILALMLYGVATLIWVYLLKFVPLSYAYSFMGLTYIAVPILSMIFLGENLNLKYWAGAALIVAGLIVVQS